MGQDHGIVEKELMNGTVTRTKEAKEKARARAKASVKPNTAKTVESRSTSE